MQKLNSQSLPNFSTNFGEEGNNNSTSTTGSAPCLRSNCTTVSVLNSQDSQQKLPSVLSQVDQEIAPQTPITQRSISSINTTEANDCTEENNKPGRKEITERSKSLSELGDTQNFKKRVNSNQYSKSDSEICLNKSKIAAQASSPNLTANTTNSIEKNNLTRNYSNKSLDHNSEVRGNVKFDELASESESLMNTTTMQDWDNVGSELSEILEHIEISSELEPLQIISRDSRQILLECQCRTFIDSVIMTGDIGVKNLPNQKPKAETMYDFLDIALKSGKNPVMILCDKIKWELNSLLHLADDNNHNFIKEIINQLNTETNLDNVISSISSNDEALPFNFMINNNIRQFLTNSEVNISDQQADELGKLLTIYCMVFNNIKVDVNLYKNNGITLLNQPLADKPVWRTSFVRLVNKVLSQTAIFVLYMAYWAMVIQNSVAEGFVSNKFSTEKIIGVIMVVYCAIVIINGSLMNAIRLHRSGKMNPDASRFQTRLLLFLNTVKDVSSLGSTVCALTGNTDYVPICQAINLISSTAYTERLISQAKEANNERFNSGKLTLLFMIPGTLLGLYPILISGLTPNFSRKLYGYDGGDTNFLMHSLKSVVSNLCTTGNSRLQEANRILILTSIFTSAGITASMFYNIYRCATPKLYKEFQSYLGFKGYLVFRYLVTLVTAAFSMVSPYSHRIKESEKAITEALKFSSTASQVIKSTTAPLLSTSHIPAEVVKDIGVFSVILTTLDTIKSMLWENGVSEFNREVIKGVLKDKNDKRLQQQIESAINKVISDKGSISILNIIHIITNCLKNNQYLDRIKESTFEPDFRDVYDTIHNTIHNTLSSIQGIRDDHIAKTDRRGDYKRVHITEVFNQADSANDLSVENNSAIRTTVVDIEKTDHETTSLLSGSNSSCDDKSISEIEEIPLKAITNSRFTVKKSK